MPKKNLTTNVEKSFGQKLEQQFARRPPGTQTSPAYEYIRAKAFRYLMMGADSYREGDHFGMPPSDCSQDSLEAIKSGCEQIFAYKGLSVEAPFTEIGIESFYDLVQLFHFRVIEQKTASLGEDKMIVDIMTVEHLVMSERKLTLFNLVSLNLGTEAK